MQPGATGCGAHDSRKSSLQSNRPALAVGSGQGFGVEAVGDGEHLLHRLAVPVQFPCEQSVRRTEKVECFTEPWAGGGTARDFVF